MAVASPTAKQQMIDILEGLPDDSSYDELLRELAFERMIEEGLEDDEQGRTISHEEMKRRISSWAK
jgi:predicted transcriptional regulator